MRKTLKQQQPFRHKLSGDDVLLRLHSTIRHKGSMKYEPMFHTVTDNYVERSFPVGDEETQLLTPDHAYLYQSIRRHGTSGDAFSLVEYAGRLGWSKSYLIAGIDRLEDVALIRREKITGYPFGGAPMDYVSFDPLEGGEFESAIEALLSRISVQWRTDPRGHKKAFHLNTYGVLRGFTAVMRYHNRKEWPLHTRQWSDIVSILTKKVSRTLHEIVLFLNTKYPDVDERQFLDLFSREFVAQDFKLNYIAERTAIEWRRKLRQGGMSALDAIVS